MASKPFVLSREDVKKIIMTLGWSLSSALIAGMVAVFADPTIDFPSWMVALVPAINTFLYGVSKWIADNRK